MDHIRPRKLSSGDRVAIVSPSTPPIGAEIAEGMRVLAQAGLEPVLGENVRNIRGRGIMAATVEDRVRELRWAAEDQSIAAILTTTGGFGSAQLLPFLPYDRLASTAKPLMGFSDTTALNNAILAECGLISINGPSASVRVGNERERRCDSEALADALQLLLDGDPWLSRPFLRTRDIVRCVAGGKAEGPAVGGNLTTFACLLGSRYFPDVAGAIVFLEDISEGGYEVARTLLHLSLAGVFRKAAGVVFGEFARAPKAVDPGDPSIEDAIRECCAGGPPCITGLNFSHGESEAALPIGGWARLDADRGSIEFDFSMA